MKPPNTISTGHTNMKIARPSQMMSGVLHMLASRQEFA